MGKIIDSKYYPYIGVILVFIALIVGYYFFSRTHKNKNKENEPFRDARPHRHLEQDVDEHEDNDDSNDDNSDADTDDTDSSDSSDDASDQDDSHVESFQPDNPASSNNGTVSFKSNDKQELKTNNTAKKGQFKNSSYKNGKRGGKSQTLDKFFEETNSPFGDSNYKGWSPDDEDKGNMASYTPGKQKIVNDNFNSADLLPNEANKDWFEDVQATSIKNPHMINIYRPVGVNTISTSLKNPSHDIRGTPPNPKNFVSPWGMSSIEPDVNIKNQALCY